MIQKKKAFLILSLSSLIWGCDSSSTSTPDGASDVKAFYIRSVDSTVVGYIEPSLLKTIQSELMESNRINDSRGLEIAYDMETGYLRKNGLLKTASYYMSDGLSFKAYSANYGWDPWSYPLPDAPSGYSSCSDNACTSARATPMTGMLVRRTNAPFDLDITYMVYYQDGPGSGWSAQKSWDQIAGPANNTAKIRAIAAMTWRDGYHIYYVAHMANGIDWLSWTYQFRPAGMIGTNEYLDAFSMLIYVF